MLVRRQSSLVFDSQASSATGISAPQITDIDPLPSAAQANEPTPSPTSPPGNQISDSPATKDPLSPAPIRSSTINVGTVVGACLGSVAVLLLITTLVIWHTRRTRKSIRLDYRPNRDKWSKLEDHRRRSHRSSFESKPSLPPLASGRAIEYPPSRSQPSGEHHTEIPRFVIPAHPYSSAQTIVTVEGRQGASTSDPFVDPDNHEKGDDGDSVFSASSNPFESVYTPPSSGIVTKQETSGSFTRSPFFAPYPDSSVQKETWGTVGKERNVQELFASESNDKLGSLIAALDLDAPSAEESKADRSVHGHLGRL